MKKLTKDPVEILMSKAQWVYGLSKDEECFKGMNEYEILRNIITVIELNNETKEVKKTSLKLVK